MPNAVYGYAGRLLRVDLSEGTLGQEDLDEEALRKYIGGAGLGAKILYEEAPPDVEWDDPRNPLILASGPLGGTAIGGSGTYCVVTIGPLTNGATTCQSNGFFGAYLRFSGFDGIAVQGIAEEWVYLYVHDGRAEVRDAGHLLGLDVVETEEAIKAELKQPGRAISVAAIGPAGENMVRFATIANDHGHIVGHNGNGAVMGSKRLKAIAVSRKGSVEVKDSKKLASLSKEFLEIVKSRGYAGVDVYQWGTLPSIQLSRGRAMAVRNMQTSVWDISDEAFEKWGPEYIRSLEIGRKPCWACQMHHCYTLKIEEGPYAGEIVEEPEYETLQACGPIIGNQDVHASMILSDYVDRLGMDVNETGWLLGMVMECYEKGLLTTEQTDGLEMTWGNVEAVRGMLSKIARREGVGDILAEGVMRAARQIGGEAINIGVYTGKGNAPRSFDHRLVWFEQLDTCVSNTGTIESGAAVWPEFLRLQPMKDYGLGLPDEVSNYLAKSKGSMQFEDSLGVCRFNVLTNIGLLCQAVNAATGWDLTFEEAMAVGRRVVNMTRLFNLRRGISSDVEKPSPRYGSAPADGPAKGLTSQPVWDKMRGDYYRLMGWDKHGVPLPETLTELGLDHLVPGLSLVSGS